MKIAVEPLRSTLGVLFSSDEATDLLSLDRKEVIEQFKSRGLILFRGFKADLEDFRAVTARFTQEFMVHRNPLRKHVDADGTTQTVQSDRSGIPFHGEMYYLPDIAGPYGRPDIIWFYCAQPAAKDGETTICDGVEMFSALDDSVKALFLRNKLKYSHRSPEKFWKAIADNPAALMNKLAAIAEVSNCRLDSDGTLLWEYHVSANSRTKYGNQEAFVNSILPRSDVYRITFEDGTDISEELRMEILKTAEKLCLPLRWEIHDLAMVDNTRCMHGRRHNDEKRQIFVRMSKANF